MKNRHLHVLSIVLITFLSACGPEPEPTLSPADVANTALADAWLAVTQTQAALPTATATLTPLPPTPTLTPLPTVPLLPTSVPATLPPSGAENPCNQPPPYQPKGTLVQVQFVNKSNGSVSLSFGMENANSLGECGTYNFGFGRFDSPTYSVLAGCYWAFAFVSGEKTSTARNISTLCVPDTSQLWKIKIGPEVIEFN
jgi:hypothetical protein